MAGVRRSGAYVVKAAESRPKSTKSVKTTVRAQSAGRSVPSRDDKRLAAQFLKDRKR